MMKMVVSSMPPASEDPTPSWPGEESGEAACLEGEGDAVEGGDGKSLGLGGRTEVEGVDDLGVDGEGVVA